MNSERLQRIEELYHAAREQAPENRDAFLAEACGPDHDLRREISSLLAQDTSGPLDQPVLHLAARLLNTAMGAQIGPYQILEPLGQGGMGSVYKARDTRLGRIVAVKVAHEEFSNRSQREARAISALNHARICTLFDVGPDYLVMELVEGELLADLLRKGPLSMGLTIEYGGQIADALAAAHAKGITHRDLKPANIMIAATGVKILDFGLAKFAEGQDPASEQAHTITAVETVVGSPAYMAPEQLEARDCDPRTDIFALGLVLYEMATGQPAFRGESRAALIADIMRCEPEMDRLSPPWFAHLVRRCLQKETENRWQTARDVQLELAHHGRAMASSIDARKLRRLLFAVAAAAALAAAGAIGLVARRSFPDVSVVPFTSFPGWETAPAFTPDGLRIAFTWNQPGAHNFDLYVKQIGPGDAQRLTTSPQAETSPRWSPDGRWIAFLRNSGRGVAEAVAIPALGGQERKLADVDSDGIDGALDWSPDGKWLVVNKRPSSDSGTGLALVSFESGATRMITNPPAKQSDSIAAFAPDGHALAFLRERGGQPGLMLLDLAGGAQPRGEPQEIPWNIPQKLTHLCWTADSRELIVAAGAAAEDSTLWRLRSAGGRSPERLSYLGNGTLPAVAQRGDRIAFTRAAGERNIWSLDLNERGEAMGPAVRAFDSSRSEYVPRFSPDGHKVVFESNRSGKDAIWTCNNDGSGCMAMTPLDGPHVGSPSWSPDGKWIAFDVFRTSVAIDIVSADGGKSRTVYQAARDGPGVGVPRWSRDGKRIYVHCDWVLQICAIPAEGGEPQPIRGAVGYFADESPDGQWLYFSTGGMAGPSALSRVPVGGGVAEVVLPEVAGRNWVVTETGVWFLTPNTGPESLLQFYDFAAKHTRTVYRPSRQVYAGLALSPNQRRILFTQLDGERGADIMIGENFR
jgi:Tol biopolymer transport system component/tRNA A-37 threonylcarbamoyl transferase component Bud32